MLELVGAGEGLSLALAAFVGQGCPIESATWVQLWARQCRWNKDSIDAATQQAAPGQGSGACRQLYSMTVSSPQFSPGPRLQQPPAFTGRGSVQIDGGSLKNAASE